MSTVYAYERYFEENTVATFVGELSELRLGLFGECLGLELVGNRERRSWLLSVDGRLSEWSGASGVMPVKVDIPFGLSCPEVLDPVVIPEETEVVCVLEVCRAARSLYVEGHWQGGRCESVRVTHTGKRHEILSVSGRAYLAG
ncbi:MAG: hypothetical protein H7Y22_08040 [Gemmatimonadaceae bacterium]|nr:hypothetical protein [Gloeobacterales cyanobacterium ES-bin-141]